MESDFSIEGWDEFVTSFVALVDKWEAKKEILLRRMLGIYREETMPFIPVDTSRLVDSFFVDIQIGGAEDYGVYGTNVEYALFVNDGYVQHKRFLPAKYISAGGKGKYLKAGAKGIMLSERYIAGKHFMEKGMTASKPRLERLIDSFMEDIKREVEGGKL